VSRGAQNFKQGDVAKAIKGATSAGLSVKRVEIDPATGKITVVAGMPESEKATPANEWDIVQ
jgi:ABC-type proline/glycine betaine transport system ATPase subunit